MLPLLADENLNFNIVRGLLRRRPDIDIVRVQDIGLSAATDPDILEWAAHAGRVLVTHDLYTMPAFAYDRVRRSESMPGVIGLGREMSVGLIIDELLLIYDCSLPGEWENQVRFLPMT